MYLKILLAYDGSNDSTQVLREGAELALCMWILYVPTVIDITGGFALAEGAAPTNLREQRYQEAQQTSERAVLALRRDGLGNREHSIWQPWGGVSLTAHGTDARFGL